MATASRPRIHRSGLHLFANSVQLGSRLIHKLCDLPKLQSIIEPHSEQQERCTNQRHRPRDREGTELSEDHEERNKMQGIQERLIAIDGMKDELPQEDRTQYETESPVVPHYDETPGPHPNESKPEDRHRPRD